MSQVMEKERQRDAQTEIRCQFCHWYFKPQPDYRRHGKTITRITTCPRCGNGIEKTFKYSYFKKFGGAK